MENICQLVKNKLEQYGYEVSQLRQTSNFKEFCIMSNSMIIFVNEEDKSLTLSFECNLEPQKVGQRMTILNDIKEINSVFITESHMFDSINKNYTIGKEAKELDLKMKIYMLMKEITEQQVYREVLMTQKCHEC